MFFSTRQARETKELLWAVQCCRDHFHMGLGKAWSEMETQLSEVRVRSIGLSNYGLHELKETMKTAKVRLQSDT